MLPDPGASPKFLRMNEVVAPDGILPISRTTFWRLRDKGKAPKGFLIGNIPYWDAAEIQAFAVAQEGR